MEYSKYKTMHDKNHTENKFYYRYATDIKDFDVNFIAELYQDFPKI